MSFKSIFVFAIIVSHLGAVQVSWCAEQSRTGKKTASLTPREGLAATAAVASLTGPTLLGQMGMKARSMGTGLVKVIKFLPRGKALVAVVGTGITLILSGCGDSGGGAGNPPDVITPPPGIGTGTLGLVWTPNSAPLTDYKVYVSQSFGIYGAPAMTIPATPDNAADAMATVTGLNVGESYSAVVTATNGSLSDGSPNESGHSNEVVGQAK